MSLALLPAPPTGFRPAIATEAELARYGFPPRPPHAAGARIGRMWAETFERDAPFTVAQLAKASYLVSQPRQPSIVNGDNSENWSGVVVRYRAGDPINLAIAGTWNVPSLASAGAGTQLIGIWIGLDGSAADTLGLSQAGIAGSIDASGTASYFAWSEWLSAADPIQPAQPISNFPIAAGDVIEIQIWVTSSTTASVVMQKLSSASRGALVVVPLIAPSGVRVVGNDAEWIVERPKVGGSAENPVFATLPSYSTVNFTHAAAWSQSAGNISMSPASFGSFALRLGFAAPVSARAVAASLDFTPPISLQEIMSETAVMFAGFGETLAMEENGTLVSVANNQGLDAFRCDYVGPAAQ